MNKTIKHNIKWFSSSSTPTTPTTSKFNNLLTSQLEKGFIALVNGELQSTKLFNTLDGTKAKIITDELSTKYSELPLATSNHEKMASLALATYLALISTSTVTKPQEATEFITNILNKAQLVAIKTNQISRFLAWDKIKFAEKGIDNFKKDNSQALTFNENNKTHVDKCFYRDFLRKNNGGEHVLPAFCKAEHQLLSQSFNSLPKIEIGMDSVIDGHDTCKIWQKKQQ
jgi:hypothetical protein